MKGHLSLVERMKTKNFYIIVLFIVATSISLWLLSYPTPSFRTIVTKTHKQINNIKNIPSNMQMHTTKELEVESLYLQRLGFMDNSVLIGNLGSGQNTLPVIASGVEPGKIEQAAHFIQSVKKYMFPRQLILFNLGLSTSELSKLKKECNSTWNCVIQPLNFEQYPSHVKYLEIKSYKPICIQEILIQYGAVIWVDTTEYFITSKINQSLSQAQVNGLLAWAIDDPTSAITHPKMFQYFKARQQDYYFLHAVESSHLVVYNTDRIHRYLMLPWVKCALLEECINPTGAQNVGCNYLRKPLFKYSGCHNYDMSALNVILGQLFNFDEHQYIGKQKVFSSLVKDKLSVRNRTHQL